MSSDLRSASVHHLLSRLRSGEPAEADRAVLEAYFGLWTTEREICEDGRATRLATLPSGRTLFLTRTGELLVVHHLERQAPLHSRLFSGSPEAIWRSLADHHPDAVPGCGALPRYWVLRENVSLAAAIYGVFDLLQLQVVSRDTDRDVVAAQVATLNSAPCATRQAA
jgi:hypothetical protein